MAVTYIPNTLNNSIDAIEAEIQALNTRIDNINTFLDVQPDTQSYNGINGFLYKTGNIVQIRFGGNLSGAVTSGSALIKIKRGFGPRIMLYVPMIIDNVWHIGTIYSSTWGKPETPDQQEDPKEVAKRYKVYTPVAIAANSNVKFFATYAVGDDL